jgi:hypothetical protein
VWRKFSSTLLIYFCSQFGLLPVFADAASPTPPAAHKTIATVPNVGDVRGVAVSAVTGKLYVAYQGGAGAQPS